MSRRDVRREADTLRAMKRYRCAACDHIYDPSEGDPNSGVPPGTPFENLLESWTCPDCGAMKSDFLPMDE